MADNDTAVHAELEIAKADMRVNKSDQSAEEVLAARQRPWNQRTIALAVILSVAFCWVYGNVILFLCLAFFWCVLFPVFLLKRKQRLLSKRDSQLKKFRKIQN